MSTSKVITLNIGGIKFLTTGTTLTQATYFQSLLSGNFSPTLDDEGAYFVDRDGALFPPILEYLRNHRLPTKGYDAETLLHEAEFYGVEGLIAELGMYTPLLPHVLPCWCVYARLAAPLLSFVLPCYCINAVSLLAPCCPLAVICSPLL